MSYLTTIFKTLLFTSINFIYNKNLIKDKNGGVCVCVCVCVSLIYGDGDGTETYMSVKSSVTYIHISGKDRIKK